MNAKLILLVASVLLAQVSDQPPQSQTYYVDGSGGDDANSGLSMSSAWKSVDKVNSTTFRPGDRLLFKAGTVYSGQLRPQGSGSATQPIIVDMFGLGDKPLIAAEGKFHEALLLKN